MTTEDILKEFDDKFGYLDKDGVSINRDAGCDDCHGNRKLRDEHRTFLQEKLDQQEQEFKKILNSGRKMYQQGREDEKQDWEEWLILNRVELYQKEMSDKIRQDTIKEIEERIGGIQRLRAKLSVLKNDLLNETYYDAYNSALNDIKNLLKELK